MILKSYCFPAAPSDQRVVGLLLLTCDFLAALPFLGMFVEMKGKEKAGRTPIKGLGISLLVTELLLS